jgi:hypothetical protein
MTFRIRLLALSLLLTLASIGLLLGYVPIEAWNNFVIVTFIVLLVVGAGATITRGVSYLRAHEPMPKLLLRDIFSRTGLALPLTLVFAVRFLRPFIDLTGLGQQPWYILLTTLPALIGVAVYAYFELFVLGGPDRQVYKLIPTQLADIAVAIEMNTQISREAFQESNHANTKIAELKSEFDKLLATLLVESRHRDAISDARYATDEARAAAAAQRAGDGHVDGGG